MKQSHNHVNAQVGNARCPATSVMPYTQRNPAVQNKGKHQRVACKYHPLHIKPVPHHHGQQLFSIPLLLLLLITANMRGGINLSATHHTAAAAHSIQIQGKHCYGLLLGRQHHYRGVGWSRCIIRVLITMPPAGMVLLPKAAMILLMHT